MNKLPNQNARKEKAKNGWSSVIDTMVGIVSVFASYRKGETKKMRCHLMIVVDIDRHSHHNDMITSTILDSSSCLPRGKKRRKWVSVILMMMMIMMSVRLVMKKVICRLF